MVMLQPRSHSWESLHHLVRHVLGLHGTLLEGRMRSIAVWCAWPVKNVVVEGWLAGRRMSEHRIEKHAGLMTVG